MKETAFPMSYCANFQLLATSASSVLTDAYVTNVYGLEVHSALSNECLVLQHVALANSFFIGHSLLQHLGGVRKEHFLSRTMHYSPEGGKCFQHA